MAEQSYAMIEEVGVGARDCGKPVLWFTVAQEGVGALQLFDLTDPVALDLIGSVREVHELNGRLCVVENMHAGGRVQFKRLVRAARRAA